MSTKIPPEIATMIQSAFHAADDLLRAQPEEYHDALVDGVIEWALTQYLPVSKYFEGIYAYSINPDDPAASQSVVIIPVINDEALAHLYPEGLPSWAK